MYMPSHFFVSKFLKEIKLIVVVTFCVWTCHPQNFVNLLIFFLPISASLFLQSLCLKRCSQMSFAVMAVHGCYYKQLKGNQA